jgi:hypothetical protein
MTASCRRYYFTALALLLALSAYPVYMGLKIVFLQFAAGGIQPADYARYVVPYTAVCLSVLATAALYPVMSKLKRFAALAATALALVLFIGIELFMERITINSSITQPAVQWQLALCIQTPDAVQAFRGPYRDVYKIHYFLVSAVLISLSIGVFYGYGKLFNGGDRRKRIPLYLQLAAFVLLLALCVFANFTGFFRGTGQYQPPLSALLTGLFFVVLGAASGIWLGSLLIGRGRLLSVALPALFAAAICSVMYYGEYNLLAGTLYRFGSTFLFRGLPGIALAPVDVLVILLAGAAAWAAMGKAKAAYVKE